MHNGTLPSQHPPDWKNRMGPCSAVSLCISPMADGVADTRAVGIMNSVLKLMAISRQKKEAELIRLLILSPFKFQNKPKLVSQKLEET
jgi:hypothetical protein